MANTHPPLFFLPDSAALPLCNGCARRALIPLLGKHPPVGRVGWGRACAPLVRGESRAHYLGLFVRGKGSRPKGGGTPSGAPAFGRDYVKDFNS